MVKFEIWLAFAGSPIRAERDPNEKPLSFYVIKDFGSLHKSHFGCGVAHFPDGTTKELTAYKTTWNTVITDGTHLLIWHDFSFEFEIDVWDIGISEIIFNNESLYAYELYPKRYIKQGETHQEVRSDREWHYGRAYRFLPEVDFLCKTPWIDYADLQEECLSHKADKAIWEVWIHPDSKNHFSHGVAHYPDGTSRELTVEHKAPDRAVLSDEHHKLVWRAIYGEPIYTEDDVIDPSYTIDIRSWPPEVMEVIFRVVDKPYSNPDYYIEGHRDWTYCWKNAFIQRPNRYDDPCRQEEQL